MHYSIQVSKKDGKENNQISVSSSNPKIFLIMFDGVQPILLHNSNRLLCSFSVSLVETTLSYMSTMVNWSLLIMLTQSLNLKRREPVK